MTKSKEQRAKKSKWEMVRSRKQLKGGKIARVVVVLQIIASCRRRLRPERPQSCNDKELKKYHTTQKTEL